MRVSALGPLEAAADAAPGDRDILETLQLAYRRGYPLQAMEINNTDFQGPTLNAFSNLKSAADEGLQSDRGFNAETMYSAGAPDLRAEPVVFSMPDVGDRFLVFPVQDGWGNIDTVIGTRTTGSGGGDFLISGPDWQGEVPAGMAHYRVRTNVAFLPGRSMVRSPEDAGAFAGTVQNSYTLTPLSPWGTGAPNANRDSISSPLPHDPARSHNAQLIGMGTNDYVNRLNARLAYNPPHDHDAPVLETFAPLGIGAGLTFDIATFSPDVQAAMATSGKNDPAEAAASYARQGMTHDTRKLAGRFGADCDLRYLLVFGGLGGNLMEDARVSLAVR